MIFFRLIGGIFLGLVWLISAGTAQYQTQETFFTLENGLRVFLLKSNAYPLLNVVAAVDVGTKNESDDNNGLVHLLEHCLLFGNSPERTRLRAELRSKGAYFNAYTGRDLMIFEISTPDESHDTALLACRDFIFSRDFTEDDFQREKEIILEEIYQIEDDPVRSGTELVLNRLFEGHPYELPVYGNPEAIARLNLDELTAFYDTYFRPERVVLTVVGNFDVDTMARGIKDLFSQVKKKDQVNLTAMPSVLALKKNVKFEKNLDVSEAYLLVGLQAPDYNSPDQYAFDVLTEIIGRGINPLLLAALNQAGSSPKNMTVVYSADYFRGALVICLRLDKKELKRAESTLIEYLKRLQNENFSADDFMGDAKYQAFDLLKGAQNSLILSARRTQDSGLLMAQSIARFISLNKKEKTPGYIEKILSVTSNQLRRISSDYLARARFVVLNVLPLEKKSPRAVK